MIGIQSEDMKDELDLNDVIRIIHKRCRLILATFLVTVLVVALTSFLIPPTYQGEATLRIKQSKNLNNSLLAEDVGSDSAVQKLLSTYAEIMRSRTVIDRVIVKTNLRNVNYEQMVRRISIEPIKDTEILKVKVRDKNGERAMILTNTLVDNFLNRISKLARSEESSVGDFIDRYLVSAKQNLDKAERALENFKREKRIVSPENETKALVDRLLSMNRLRAENNITLAAAKAKLDTAQNELSQGNPLISDKLSMSQYQEKLANAEVELVEKLHGFGEGSPQVAVIRSEINELKMKLNNETNKVVNGEGTASNPIYQSLLQGKMQANADIAAATAQETAINKITADTEKMISKLPATEQELARLMRDVSLAQEIYVMLSKRREEAKITEVMIPTDVQIVDRAIMPDKPIFPNKILNILIAAIVGLFAGLFLAFLVEYLKKTIDTTDDVNNYLKLPVLGNIPDFK